jgi:hypothetical protein
MMKMFLPLVLFLCGSSAFARIGETLEECQTRYGVMQSVNMRRSDYPMYIFRKGDIMIGVRLYNGKSAQEVFIGDGKQITTNQISEITRANYDPKVEVHIETKYSDDLKSNALFIITKEFEKVFGELETGF